MKRLLSILLLLTLSAMLPAQEALSSLCRPESPAQKGSDSVLTLPFFDDFSNTNLSNNLWHLGGTFVNQGYAPLPPTIGMATLDAFNAEGGLYPTAISQLFTGDTLTSLPIRLDSIFYPYTRSLTADDSVYLSFFYLPGGGYGNMWERSGDTPESQDSLILEFYDPMLQNWDRVWVSPGIHPDSLYAHTGHYWQFVDIPLLNAQYFQPGFRFRFCNLCSLDNINKKGILSNADQWNIDYVYLNHSRHLHDTASRDIAFVNPAPSMLRHYQAMPSRQFTATDMADTLPLTITNRFTQELATDYGYRIYDSQQQVLHIYDGGYENTPVYWRAHSYQTSPAHARPVLNYILPVSPEEPSTFTIVHGLREGVSGDIHTQNDTIAYTQTFDNYYAYDDGTPENGYGITSTTPSVRIACRFSLNVEDTLTTLLLYFNRTFADQNSSIRFYITVWDDAGGHPGNIIYQDRDRRRPLFSGFNQYVRYTLEQPLVCSGTIYIGIEQNSADYINLGFDRNNDASQHILYLTGSEWQTSILRGALMLRPAFGQRATVAIDSPKANTLTAFRQGSSIVIRTANPTHVAVFNIMGQKVYECTTQRTATQYTTQPLPAGLYLVRAGNAPAHKIAIP